MSTPAPTLTPDARLLQATVKKRFRWQFAAAAAVVMVVAALLTGYLVNLLQTQNTVVILRSDVARGNELTAADLGQITVGVITGVDVVPATQIPSLVGKRAASDLVKGSLLNSAAVTESVLPSAGKSLVGLQLAPGRIVSSQLRPGSVVRLIELPPANDNPAAVASQAPAPLATYQAIVVRTSTGVNQGSTMLDVEIDSKVADKVSRLAARDLLTVIQDAG